MLLGVLFIDSLILTGLYNICTIIHRYRKETEFQRESVTCPSSQKLRYGRVEISAPPAPPSAFAVGGGSAALRADP